MNGIINGFRRFIKNKNVVTILGLLLIIGILYFGYTSTIKKQVNPIRNIPVAAVTIQPGTLITESMIEYISVSPVVFNYGNVVRFPNLVVGKYSDYNTVIPKGSLFYSDVLVEAEDLPKNEFVKIKDGDVVYKFLVNSTTTYGNSIFPGQKIDIYMKAENISGQVMVGKLLENIEVVSVKTSNGQDVFQNSEQQLAPAMLIFGLSPENNNLLLKASYLSSYSVELFPVPQGGTVDSTGSTRVASQALKDFINAYSVPNDELNEVIDNTDTTTDTEAGN